jgi:bacteriophage N4 adsorption protein B
VWVDRLVAACLAPLAVWILLSGLDDLFIAAVRAVMRRRPFPWPSDAELDGAAERRIAILVPLWREHRVIGRMLEHNLAVIRYSNYDVFVGVYPNDELTERAVSEAALRNPQVHLALCAHKSPTSKGDCLNWIFRTMREYETRERVRFDIVITHDAEDLIDGDSLRLINWFARDYDMVQIPVLALPTPAREWTHGIYCDEFAEYQTKDIPVRQRLGGFLPANGVGTGFRREALEQLAATRDGRVFDPHCLTEDYETGYRLHALGFRQIFVPMQHRNAPVATREYFPRGARAAIRQRSRWVAGIALQGWQLHGWRGSWGQRYWFWRDRKGLVGNLLSPAANLLLAYMVCARLAGRTEVFTFVPRWVGWSCAGMGAMSVVQVLDRARSTARFYGWRMAALTPVRVIWANQVNGLATLVALGQFLVARVRRSGLVWRKTDHVYIAQGHSRPGRPRLGEVLVRMRRLTPEEVEGAVREAPRELRLGEYLVHTRKLSEQDLYEALSVQTGIPLGRPAKREFHAAATRVVPAAAARRWKVLPYRVAMGQLHVLTSDVPTEELTRELAEFSGLEIRFRLVRPDEFDELADAYLGVAVSATP